MEQTAQNTAQVETTGAENTSPAVEDKNTESAEETIARLNAEVERLKGANDNLSKENAQRKRDAKAYEGAKTEKDGRIAALEEQVKALTTERTVSASTNSLMAAGLSGEDAAKLAGELGEHTDALDTICEIVKAAVERANNAAKEAGMQRMGGVTEPKGNKAVDGEKDGTDLNKIGYKKLLEMYNKNPEAYKAATGQK